MELRETLTVLCILAFVQPTLQLECYICKNQESNKGKCVETVKTCELNQDKCLTEVSWGSVPHWASAGQKQLFISKRCASKLECPDDTMAKSPKCDRIWYNDWTCPECCSGDKCNYYVTLSGHAIKPMNLIFILACSIFASLINILW